MRRRVAVFLDAIEDDYQVGILRGVIHEAQLSNVDLICFAGGVLGASEGDPEHPRNFVFGLVDENRYDGLVVFSAALSNFVGRAKFEEWVGKLPKIPRVHIGLSIPGEASLVVDGGRTMRDLVEHVVTAHGRTNVAFLRGPEQSYEAEERYQAYRDVLSGHGIEIPPENILQGNWLKESAVSEVSRAIEENRSFLRGGALVCANDYMALGALGTIREVGLSIPGDVLVTGFDDIEATHSAAPPLTTVRQPTFRLGQEGMKALLGVLNGRDPDERIDLPAQLVTRASCGCRSSASLFPKKARAEGRRYLRTELISNRPVLEAELLRAARGIFQGVGAGWEGRLLEALTADLITPGLYMLPQVVEKMVTKLRTGPSESEALHDVLTVLRDSVLELGGEDAGPIARALGLIDRARQRVFDAALREQMSKSTSSLRTLRLVAEVVGILRRQSISAEFRKIGEQHLRAAGVSAVVLGALPSGLERDALASTVFSYAEEPGVPSLPTFKIGDLAPFDIAELSSETLLVQPVVTGGRPSALLVLPWGLFEPMVYEQIRELFGIAGLSGTS